MPLTPTAYAPSSLLSTRVPTNSGSIVGGRKPMKSRESRRGMLMMESEFDISDTC